jgi:hypothetical protein
LEGLEIKDTATADEKTKEECCPGKPFIMYRTEVIVL